MITLPVNANTLVGEGGSRADGEQTGERELGQVSESLPSLRVLCPTAPVLLFWPCYGHRWASISRSRT